jgi:hypothetical protein
MPIIRGTAMGTPPEPVLVVVIVVVVVTVANSGIVEGTNYLASVSNLKENSKRGKENEGFYTVILTRFPAESVSVRTVDVEGGAVIVEGGAVIVGVGSAGPSMPLFGKAWLRIEYVKPLSEKDPPQKLPF